VSDTEPSWRRLASEDGEALKSFLLAHEDFAAGFSSRILKGDEVRIPGLVFGGAFGLDGKDGLLGAILWTPPGSIFPIFDEPLSACQRESLSRFFWGGSMVSFLGATPHTLAFEEALGVDPRVRVAYRSMYRSVPTEFSQLPVPESGASVSLAEPGDLMDLVPLHAAYEQEEVVTSIHRFDPAASRASLKHILSSEIVAAARLNGRIVATARTNARGFRTWQIGGVYVVPELRRQGWGRYVVGFLIDRIAGIGKAASLFVKERNAPAQGLYRSMGFRDAGPYSVDYL
jgi:uncharacterized protein